jgi:hypothetical protein
LRLFNPRQPRDPLGEKIDQQPYPRDADRSGTISMLSGTDGGA